MTKRRLYLSDMARKSKCSASGCKKKTVLIVGDCKFCQMSHCSSHRLPEDHKCVEMEACRLQSYELNAKRLVSEGCVSEKIIRI